MKNEIENQNQEAEKLAIQQDFANLKMRFSSITSVAQLEDFINQADSIISKGSQFGLSLQRSELLETLLEKLKKEEVGIKTLQSDERLADTAQVEHQKALKEEEAAYDKIYDKLDSFSHDYSQKQSQYNSNLYKALGDIKAGKNIDEELKKKLLKSPEEIKLKKEQWEHIKHSRKKALADHEHCEKQLSAIKQEINSLPEHEVDKKQELHKKKQHYEDRQLKVKEKIAITDHHYEERGREAKYIVDGFKANKIHKNEHNQKHLEDQKRQFREYYADENNLEQHAEEYRAHEAKVKATLAYVPSNADEYSLRTLRACAAKIEMNTPPAVLQAIKQQEQGQKIGKKEEAAIEDMSRNKGGSISPPPPTPSNSGKIQENKGKSGRV